MQHKYKLLPLICLLFFAACSPSEEELSQKSRSLMDEGKYAEAVGFLDRLLEKNPENASAYNMRGVAYLEQGNREDALSDFNQAIRYDSVSYKPLFNRANIYRLNRQFPEALQDYNQVVRKEPTLADVYINRSAVFYEMGSYSQALKDLEVALGLDQGNTQVHFNLAKLHLVMEKPAQAKISLAKVLEQDGKNSEAFYLLGLALLAEKDADEACRYFKRASKMGNEDARLAVGRNCAENKAI